METLELELTTDEIYEIYSLLHEIEDSKAKRVYEMLFKDVDENGLPLK